MGFSRDKKKEGKNAENEGGKERDEGKINLKTNDGRNPRKRKYGETEN